MKDEIAHRVAARRSYAQRMATRMMSKGVRKRTHAGKYVKWQVAGLTTIRPANFVSHTLPNDAYVSRKREQETNGLERACRLRVL